MNVTLTSLEALILKATQESLPQPDAAALEAFCAVMRDSTEGPQLAAQSLAARIHSQNTREALLALMMLDRCMRRCDANFHAEVGKFRFLNEMIKLVSPKYFADRTASEVRTRVLQLLHAWSIEYQKETKFKVAFDMLKNQGVITETPPPLSPEDNSINASPRPKNAIFEDEEKSKLLQKLLQSKNPEDLQHANRLIKTMVRDEERRNEANSRRAQEVGAALDSAELLRDMLQHAQDASADEEQLIHELHSCCARLRLVLQRLAATDTQPENLSDILHANDVLDEVFDKYNKFVAEKRCKPKKSDREAQGSNSHSLLDFAGANAHRSEEPKNRSSNALEELGDIFSNDSSTNNVAEPLKPLNLMYGGDIELLGEKESKVEGWNELDSLGEKLLKESLPDNARRKDNFNTKHTKKIPMNALEKPSPKHDTQVTSDTGLLDLDFFNKKTEENKPSTPAHSSKSNDDLMIDISSDEGATNRNDNFSLNANIPLYNVMDALIGHNTETLDSKSTGNEEMNAMSEPEVGPLTADINVTLQNLHPSEVPPLMIYGQVGGLEVVLHFCRDKPRPDVSVVVVSTTSRFRSAVRNYQFQPVVPKAYEVRLLEASSRDLPAYNPFAPPPAVTQLMLIGARRAAPPPWLEFELSYFRDGEPFTATGRVASLPLNRIH